MDDELRRIAGKIKQWREEAGLTLQQLGENSGVSASTVHKLENAQTVPTIAVLLKLAHGLQRRPNELFEPEPSEPPVAVNRLAERENFETRPGTLFQHVVVGIPHSQIDVWRIIHEPGCGTVSDSGEERLRYPGELVILVEEGQLCVEVDGEEYSLESGDSIHFKTSLPHLWRNRGAVTAQALFFALLPRGVQKGPVS